MGIIIIIFLARAIGQMAHEKGQKKVKWWAITLAVWYGAQLLTAFVGVIVWMLIDPLADPDATPILIEIIIPLIMSVIAYAFLYRYVKRLPDPMNDLESKIEDFGKNIVE